MQQASETALPKTGWIHTIQWNWICKQGFSLARFDCQRLAFIETRAFDIHGQRMAELMDVKDLGKNHKNQPLVLSGWSVVSNVGIEPPQKKLVSETGSEHLGNAEIWANIQHRLMSGCMGAFLFQILALVFVDVSSIRIGRAFALDCLSGYRSGATAKEKKTHIWKRNRYFLYGWFHAATTCYSLARNAFHTCSFARGHAIGGINQNPSQSRRIRRFVRVCSCLFYL